MVQSKHRKRYCVGIRPSSFLGTDIGTHVISSSSPPFVCRTSQLDESVAASFFVPLSAGPHLYSVHLDMYRKSIRHPQSAIYRVWIIPAMLMISLSVSCVSIGVDIELLYQVGDRAGPLIFFDRTVAAGLFCEMTIVSSWSFWKQRWLQLQMACNSEIDLKPHHPEF
jgi:hypothetical protein